MALAALVTSLLALGLALWALRTARALHWRSIPDSSPIQTAPTDDGRIQAALNELTARLDQVERHLEGTPLATQTGLQVLAQRLAQLESQVPGPKVVQPTTQPILTQLPPKTHESDEIRKNLQNLQLECPPTLSQRLENLVTQLDHVVGQLPHDDTAYQSFRRNLLPELLEILEDQGNLEAILKPLAGLLGVRFIHPLRGDEYLSEAHELLKVERTDDASLTNKVALCLSFGLMQGEVTLRKAEVSVFR